MEIQIPQILFQMVNFFVVMGALTYLLYKPVLKILEERSQKIAEAQKEAEATIAEKQRLDEYSKKVKKEAEKEAAAIIAEARTSAQAQATQVMTNAKKEAQKQIDGMQEAWEQEKKRQMTSMKQEFNQATLAVTEKVLGSAFDEKTLSKIVDQELKTLLKSI